MTTPHANHGQTPAAWTAVAIMILGFLIGGIAVVLALPWLFVVAVAVILLGALAGKVLAMLGFGQTPGFHDGSNAKARSFHEQHPEEPGEARQTGPHAPGTTGEHVQE